MLFAKCSELRRVCPAAPRVVGWRVRQSRPLHSVHENADVHVSLKTSAPTLASRTRASGALIPTLRRKWLSRCMEKSSAFHGPVRALRYGLHDGVTRVLSARVCGGELNHTSCVTVCAKPKAAGWPRRRPSWTANRSRPRTRREHAATMRARRSRGANVMWRWTVWA